MFEQGTGSGANDLGDAEAGYVHSVAPDPRRLDPLDNPVRPHVLDGFFIVLTYI
jgi:hypothetical protein